MKHLTESSALWITANTHWLEALQFYMETIITLITMSIWCKQQNESDRSIKTHTMSKGVIVGHHTRKTPKHMGVLVVTAVDSSVTYRDRMSPALQNVCLFQHCIKGTSAFKATQGALHQAQNWPSSMLSHMKALTVSSRCFTVVCSLDSDWSGLQKTQTMRPCSHLSNWLLKCEQYVLEVPCMQCSEHNREWKSHVLHLTQKR